jgi:hypothetical protein
VSSLLTIASIYFTHFDYDLTHYLRDRNNGGLLNTLSHSYGAYGNVAGDASYYYREIWHGVSSDNHPTPFSTRLLPTISGSELIAAGAETVATSEHHTHSNLFAM